MNQFIEGHVKSLATTPIDGFVLDGKRLMELLSISADINIDFSAGIAQYFTTQKQRESRIRNGTLQKHQTNQLHYERKKTSK